MWKVAMIHLTSGYPTRKAIRSEQGRKNLCNPLQLIAVLSFHDFLKTLVSQVGLTNPLGY
jgi:hypothetical protein